MFGEQVMVTRIYILLGVYLCINSSPQQLFELKDVLHFVLNLQETIFPFPDITGSQWPRRWTIVGLCCAAFMLCNMDRVNMSIAILPMSEQFQWDSQMKGLVQSSFFWCVGSTTALGIWFKGNLYYTGLSTPL